MRKRLVLVAWLLLAIFGVGYADELPPASFHLALGNPSHATTDASNKDNYLLEKPYFAVSYSNTKGIPNWVSWHFSAAYLGKAARKQRFDTDETLPAGFKQVTHADYTGSGFDRGHLCPHSDRALNKTTSYATFIMTNIVPQSHENNAGDWEALESYERELAGQEGKDLFIVAGPIGQGGTGDKGAATTIADGKVVVPAKLFKVLLVLHHGAGADPTKWVDADARLIAVIMPNDTTKVTGGWAKYRCSVADVEKATGYKFFDQAPAAIIAPLKLQVDQVKISTPAKEH